MEFSYRTSFKLPPSIAPKLSLRETRRVFFRTTQSPTSKISDININYISFLHKRKTLLSLAVLHSKFPKSKPRGTFSHH